MSDDTTLATKADIGRVENGMQKMEHSIQKIENSVQRMGHSIQEVEHSIQGLGNTLEKGMAGLREADDQILTVLTNVNERLTGRVEDHEKRITRLEAAVV